MFLRGSELSIIFTRHLQQPPNTISLSICCYDLLHQDSGLAQCTRNLAFLEQLRNHHSQSRFLLVTDEIRVIMISEFKLPTNAPLNLYIYERVIQLSEDISLRCVLGAHLYALMPSEKQYTGRWKPSGPLFKAL